MSAPQTAGTSAEPDRSTRSGSGWGGCGLWAVAFLVVTIGGCSVGLSLRSDPNAAQRPVTVEAGAGWTLQVHQDVSKAPCTELFGEPASQGGDPPFLAGQCAYATTEDKSGLTRYQATSFKVKGQVVVFGPVPAKVRSVRLTLGDGSHPEVGTGSRQGVRYFVKAGDAEDVGPTTLLDSAGKPVTPPPEKPVG